MGLDVENVARKMYYGEHMPDAWKFEELDFLYQELWRRRAKNAIKATLEDMREPTREMIAAARDLEFDCGILTGPSGSDYWRAMIDEARKYGRN